MNRLRPWNQYTELCEVAYAIAHAHADKLRVKEFADLRHPAHVVNEKKECADVDPHVERQHVSAARQDGTLSACSGSHCNVWYTMLKAFHNAS